MNVLYVPQFEIIYVGCLSRLKIVGTSVESGEIPERNTKFKMSIIFPASKKKVTIVMIGSATHYPSPSDMEEIRDWVRDHQDSWPESFKEMSSLFGFAFTFKNWPAISNNLEYVWLIENLYSEDSESIKVWRDLFDTIDKEYLEQDWKNFFIFAVEPVKITRLNKILVPFL